MGKRSLFNAESESEAEQNSQEVPLLEDCDLMEPFSPHTVSKELASDLDFSHFDHTPNNQLEYFGQIENSPEPVPDSDRTPSFCKWFYHLL